MLSYSRANGDFATCEKGLAVRLPRRCKVSIIWAAMYACDSLAVVFDGAPDILHKFTDSVVMRFLRSAMTVLQHLARIWLYCIVHTTHLSLQVPDFDFAGCAASSQKLGAFAEANSVHNRQAAVRLWRQNPHDCPSDIVECQLAAGSSCYNHSIVLVPA